DQGTQRGGIDPGVRLQLYVPHAPAAAFEHAGGIGQVRAMEEADVHVGPEDVEVRERRILHARHRAPVVYELADVPAALPHPPEPRARGQPERARPLAQPDLDGRVMPGRAHHTEDGIHAQPFPGEVDGPAAAALRQAPCSTTIGPPPATPPWETPRTTRPRARRAPRSSPRA